MTSSPLYFYLFILFSTLVWLLIPLTYFETKKVVKRFFWKLRILNKFDDYSFFYYMSIMFVSLSASIAGNVISLMFLIIYLKHNFSMLVIFVYIIYQILNIFALFICMELYLIVNSITRKKIYSNSIYLLILYRHFIKNKPSKFDLQIKNIILNSQIEKIKDINNIYKKIFESTLNNKGLLNEFYYDWLLFTHICKTQKISLFKINRFFRKLYKGAKLAKMQNKK